MSSLNQVNIIGNVGTVELKATESGTPYLKFSVAVNESWKDESGEKREHTEWFRNTLWGKRATSLAPYIKKGDKIFVTGSLKTDKVGEGEDAKYFVGVNVRDVTLLGNKKDAQNASDEAFPE